MLSEDLAKNLEIGVDLVRDEEEFDPSTGKKALFRNVYRLQKLSIKIDTKALEDQISEKRVELAKLETIHSELTKNDPKPTEEVKEEVPEEEVPEEEVPEEEENPAIEVEEETPLEDTENK